MKTIGVTFPDDKKKLFCGRCGIKIESKTYYGLLSTYKKFCSSECRELYSYSLEVKERRSNA